MIPCSNGLALVLGYTGPIHALTEGRSRVMFGLFRRANSTHGWNRRLVLIGTVPVDRYPFDHGVTELFIPSICVSRKAKNRDLLTVPHVRFRTKQFESGRSDR